jgi:hypothetical protein
MIEACKQLKIINDMIAQGKIRSTAIRYGEEVIEGQSHLAAQQAAGNRLGELGYVSIEGEFIPIPTVTPPTTIIQIP